MQLMNSYVFNHATRDALSRARDEAVKHNHEYVGTEHILLGLLALDYDRLNALMRKLGLDRAAVAAKVESIIKTGKTATPAWADLPFTTRAKRVLELAMETAREMGTSDMGPELLLAGLCAEERNIGAKVLSDSGVGLDEVRKAMADIDT
jgi:ATP-dependent Clp protease ATP-binding subunit ClpC